MSEWVERERELSGRTWGSEQEKDWMNGKFGWKQSKQHTQKSFFTWKIISISVLRHAVTNVSFASRPPVFGAVAKYVAAGVCTLARVLVFFALPAALGRGLLPFFAAFDGGGGCALAVLPGRFPPFEEGRLPIPPLAAAVAADFLLPLVLAALDALDALDALGFGFDFGFDFGFLLLALPA